MSRARVLLVVLAVYGAMILFSHLFLDAMSRTPAFLP